MKNNLKGMLIGSAIGLIGCGYYILDWNSKSHNPFFDGGIDEIVGISFVMIVASVLGFMVGSGIKEK